MTLNNLVGTKLEIISIDLEAVKRLISSATRCIADSKIAAVSAENRFDSAYKAIMQIANAALQINGYRTLTSQPGHHLTMIQSLPKTVGIDKDTMILLDAMRKQRNIVDYSGDIIPESAVKDCIIQAEKLLKTFIDKFNFRENHPRLSAIVAMAENRVIGINNQLPWKLPADLKHFKNITTGHPILMGRKTYESIGRPLPNRMNIIMTRDRHYQANGCHVVTGIDEALQLAAHENKNEIFVIGGAEVYKQLLPQIDRLYLTIVHHPFEGDAYFPALNQVDWQEISHEKHTADADNPYGYSFLVWDKTPII